MQEKGLTKIHRDNWKESINQVKTKKQFYEK